MPRESVGYFVPKEWDERRGTGKCAVCAIPKPEWPEKQRIYYCSQKCYDAYHEKILYWSTYREKVFDRDNWTCVKCGCGRKPFQEWYARAEKWFAENHKKEGERWYVDTEFGPKWYQDAYEIITGDQRPQLGPDLEADHIVAISLGGDMWDMANLQTLCKPCHGKKSGQDVRKLNIIKRHGKATNGMRITDFMEAH